MDPEEPADERPDEVEEEPETEVERLSAAMVRAQRHWMRRGR